MLNFSDIYKINPKRLILRHIKRAIMSFISTALAQDIVQRTMQIIPFNVNVMDEHGTIIASGNPSRVGELHSGALVALARQAIVEVDTATEKSMHGSKSGINLPLTVNGVQCGVIGISGAPEEVRQFGQLVKLSAEMILEQSQLISELQRSTSYKETFLLKMIHPEQATLTDIHAWGQRLAYHFEHTQLVFILHIKAEQAEPLLKAMQDIQNHLNTSGHLISAINSPQELIILDSYKPSSRSNAEDMAKQRLEIVRKLIVKKITTNFRLSMGMASTGEQGIRISYLSAKAAAEQGQRHSRNNGIHSYYDLTLPILLSGLNSSWQAEQLQKPLIELQKKDKTSHMFCIS